MMATSACGLCADALPYAVADKPWPQPLGNHRAVVRVAAKADAVRVHLPWRRPDKAPGRKNVLVVDAKTGQQLANVVRVAVSREFGDLVFQPKTAPGDYFVYYLPTVTHGRAFVRTVYPAPKDTADPAWVARHKLTKDGLAGGAWRKLPAAQVARLLDA